jgi:c-di-GMP-binding flagellar brake protein YcgR
VDHRQYKRLPLQFPVRLSNQQGESTGVLTDLSMVGCAVNVEASLEVGTLLRLRLHIPGDQRPITVETAEVRAIGVRRCGLRFVHMEDAEKNRLKKLIESQWERDNF